MFYSFDLDPLTLVLKLDLDMVKMYLHTKNEVPSYSGSKVIAWTDRQTRVKLLPTAYADGKYAVTNGTSTLLAIHDKTSCEDVMNYCDFLRELLYFYISWHLIYQVEKCSDFGKLWKI